jgi:hypothetical protein
MTGLTNSKNLMLHYKSLSQQAAFARGVRAAVYGLWSDSLDLFNFLDAMYATVQMGLTNAWYEGAERAGIMPDEITDEERRELRNQVSTQANYMIGFADAIVKGSKKNKGKFAPLMSRAQMWINQYSSVANLALVMAKNDPKLKWIYGDFVKTHCRSCLKLNGKVKRASYWRRLEIRPQAYRNPKLECRGLRCQCKFSPTSEPLSKGPLPRLP